MQLNHGLVILDEHIFHMQLRALRKNPAQLGEGTGDERLLAGIVTCERMCAHHGLINSVGHMLKESGAVAILQPFEISLTCYG